MINMGNDEFILSLRKNYPQCNIENDQLGKKIKDLMIMQRFYREINYVNGKLKEIVCQQQNYLRLLHSFRLIGKF